MDYNVYLLAYRTAMCLRENHLDSNHNRIQCVDDRMMSVLLFGKAHVNIAFVCLFIYYAYTSHMILLHTAKTHIVVVIHHSANINRYHWKL